MRQTICLVSTLAAFLFLSSTTQGQYWQQRVEYNIDVAMSASDNNFSGKQALTYYNNSPDTLRKAFFHLYLNAFRPGSDMDVRSRAIPDPDLRVADKISKLTPPQYGEQKILKLLQDGKPANFNVEGTILEVRLPQPILPGASTKFEIEFQGQAPSQIRRTGRDNEEGIRLSMSQWYPKICEYDAYGWHANPYIGREFHGVWGDFDVKIKIDAAYTVAATGTLQNPQEIGHGYGMLGDPEVAHPAGKVLEWHFKAKRVHDFVWAADPDFTHVRSTAGTGIQLHFFYRKDSTTINWAELPQYTARAFEIMGRDYGLYPYTDFSVIQGGDGGMEYPMATLITGRRNLGSLVGVTVHELIHSWFQGMLATNESLYPWMDEGFTSYATHEVMEELFPSGAKNPHARAYDSYFNLLEYGEPEPLSVHADHYQTNYCYGVNAYSKGEVLLAQLGYVIGPENLQRGMQWYFKAWQFKHPTPVDFMRIMEKASDMELDWYFEYFVNTLHSIDYGIRSVKPDPESRKHCIIELARIGGMPMPIDVQVILKKGDTLRSYIPLDLMRGQRTFKAIEDVGTLIDWHWVSPTYTIRLPVSDSDIVSIEIDPAGHLADTERANNRMNAETIRKKPWEEYEK